MYIWDWAINWISARNRWSRNMEGPRDRGAGRTISPPVPWPARHKNPWLRLPSVSNTCACVCAVQTCETRHEIINTSTDIGCAPKLNLTTTVTYEDEAN